MRPTTTRTLLARNGIRQPHAKNDSALMVRAMIRYVALDKEKAREAPSCGKTA
jgi:hypothetical protein